MRDCCVYIKRTVGEKMLQAGALITYLQDRSSLVAFAVNEPKSSRRRRQVWTLWHLDRPELHNHISRQRNDDWFSWANSLPQSTSFIADTSVHAILGSSATRENLKKQQAFTGAENRLTKRLKVCQELRGYCRLAKLDHISTNCHPVSSDLYPPTNCEPIPERVPK